MRHVFITVLVCVIGVFLAGCGEQVSTPAPSNQVSTPAPSDAVPIPIPTYEKPASIPSPDPLPTAPDLKGK